MNEDAQINDTCLDVICMFVAELYEGAQHVLLSAAVTAWGFFETAASTQVWRGGLGLGLQVAVVQWWKPLPAVEQQTAACEPWQLHLKRPLDLLWQTVGSMHA
jgi:hypothetical protein